MTTTDALAPLHPDATGLTLFRTLPNGTGRAYSEVEFTRGRAGVEHFLRQLRAFGYVRNSSSDPKSGYGVLDVLNADGDIVQDYEVTSARAHAYIKRKLRLTVVQPPAAAVAR
ncbi:hypothetical protein [Micromonospora carbonacea]|uniref:hypothetical protein n=1 Tax=Micromonospora carbonacea TaxID=47853 RepID=UPI0033EC6B84